LQKSKISIFKFTKLQPTIYTNRCAASDLGTNHQRKLLRINDNFVDTLDWSPQKTLYTIWFPSIHKIYAGGGKTYARCENDWVEQTAVNFFTYGIRGNDYNDVYAVGGGHFSHFNGYRWKEIPELFLTGGNYEGLATKQNGFVTLKIYDILGKEVVTLVNELKNQGRYAINFDASMLASGVFSTELSYTSSHCFADIEARENDSFAYPDFNHH